MAIFTTQIGVEIEFNALDDRKFHAAQAIMSQMLLDADDRAGRRGARVDEASRYDCRMMAVDEWSAAVRNGFVCC